MSEYAGVPEKKKQQNQHKFPKKRPVRTHYFVSKFNFFNSLSSLPQRARTLRER